MQTGNSPGIIGLHLLYLHLIVIQILPQILQLMMS